MFSPISFLEGLFFLESSKLALALNKGEQSFSMLILVMRSALPTPKSRGLVQRSQHAAF